MNDSPAALRRTIAATQEELSHDLDVLEAKGRELVDWRAHFEKHPLALLGAAFVGGVLAAAVVSGGRSSRRGSGASYAEPSPQWDRPRREPSPTWERLRTGLGAAAAGVAMEAISKALPGLKQHVIDPVRSSLRPEGADKSWGGVERRFSGMGQTKPQGNGHGA